MKNPLLMLCMGITSVSVFTTSQAGLDAFLQDAAKQYTSGDKTSPASALSNEQVNNGLKEALSIGTERAVALLGAQNGFLNNPKVRIGLPDSLDSVGSALRAVGKGSLVDDFELTVNRAAEEAIPKTLGIVQSTIQNMTLDDVQGILNGGDAAATEFLRNNSWDAMHKTVKPIVAKATDQTGATASYKKLTADSGGAIGSLGGLLGGSSSSLDLDNYVTDKTLDGMFLMLAEEEKQIRNNPLARSTDLLKQVFN